MDCCSVYSEEFDRPAALSEAQRFRKRGLDRVSREVASAIEGRDVEGAHVLEIGGGVGALCIELLLGGAASAVNVELSSSYRDAASALALEAGVSDRLEQIAADGTRYASERRGGFDIVILNRVVCCYPDARSLLAAAAAAARRMVVASYPTVHPISRAIVRVSNYVRERRGSDFRVFVHPEETLVEPARSGLRQVYLRARPVWSVRAWTRGS